MAATTDPRAKPRAANHLEPWARQPRPHRRSADGGGEEPCADGIEDLWAKLMGHLRDATDRLRVVPQPTHPLPQPTNEREMRNLAVAEDSPHTGEASAS